MEFLKNIHFSRMWKIFSQLFAWLQSACSSIHYLKQLTDDVFFGFKKPIIWAKRRLTGLRSHGRLVLIDQDIMVVEVTHPQVGAVNTPTMIMMNPQRNTVLGMSTTNSVTPPPPHHETTVITAVALAGTALHATLQRTLGPPVLPGHTLKTNLPALTVEAPLLHKEGVVQTPVLPSQVPETQATSLENQTLVITMALEDGARDPREIEQPPGSRTPRHQYLNHSSSLHRAILGSSGQVVRAILGDI